MNLEQKPLISAVASTSNTDTCSHVDEWIALDQSPPSCEEVGGMVVRSANMRRVLKMIQRLGPYKASVLIHGESGTG
ncbi:MAG: sigma 54-interacting transcriptional regulator, partial [Candidatus Binataceae bacterium]